MKNYNGGYATLQVLMAVYLQTVSHRRIQQNDVASDSRRVHPTSTRLMSRKMKTRTRQLRKPTADVWKIANETTEQLSKWILRLPK